MTSARQTLFFSFYTATLSPFVRSNVPYRVLFWPGGCAVSAGRRAKQADVHCQLEKIHYYVKIHHLSNPFGIIIKKKTTSLWACRGTSHAFGKSNFFQFSTSLTHEICHLWCHGGLRHLAQVWRGRRLQSGVWSGLGFISFFTTKHICNNASSIWGHSVLMKWSHRCSSPPHSSVCGKHRSKCSV